MAKRQEKFIISYSFKGEKDDGSFFRISTYKNLPIVQITSS